jgi:hypothetical protein
MRYEPPPASRAVLGAVVDLLADKQTAALPHLTGATYICRLPGGEIYYDSKLDLDSDGSKYAAQDKTGQAETSLRYPDGRSVDADQISYFVLPGGFYEKHGIKLGDLAAVIYGARVAFAIFGDTGPKSKIGEGSIALHRALGHETIRNGKFHDVGIDKHVITIVFPRSGDGKPKPQAQINTLGAQYLSDLVKSG